MTYNIEFTSKIEVNTDPRRRCYNGCHAKTELVDLPWSLLELEIPAERVEDRIKFWRELNDYAISRRGESARKEFRATPSSQ